MSEETRFQTLAPPRTHDRRLVILLILLGLALFLLLLNLAGSQKTFALIATAHPIFVGFILVLQALRYAGSAGSTYILAVVFGKRVPFLPLYEVMMTGQALNRTFSVGGAAGMWARYSFLTRQGMHSGPFAALLVVEDLIGAAAMLVVFLAGLAGVVTASALPQVAWLSLLGFGMGTVALGGAAIYLFRHRGIVRRVVHAIGRAFSGVLARIIGKEVYRREHMDEILDEFYRAVSHARTDPPRLAAAFAFSILRLSLDAASLYFAFWAVGYAISPGICLIIFTSSTVLSTVSAAPGELGVMEASLAILSTSLGIPPPTAVSATLLFRALSYWLPIPAGYLTFGHLERQGLI